MPEKGEAVEVGPCQRYIGGERVEWGRAVSGTVLMMGSRVEREVVDNLQQSGIGLTWGGGIKFSTKGRVGNVPN